MVWFYADCGNWKTSVHFKLMIDLSFRDVSCINSTLSYVARHVAENGIKPILTFD